ncbi:MAG: flagellar biosynthesis protein FlhB [Planctomycetota bacterium]
MPERDERTEPATPRRRAEARMRGQIAKSHDLVVASILLAGFVALELAGGRIWSSMLSIMKSALSPQEPWSLAETLPFTLAASSETGWRLAPVLLAVAAAAFVVLFAQTGPLLTFEPITPSLSKINPLQGIARLFSVNSIVHTLMNIAKLVLVASVGYAAVASYIPAVIHAFTLGHMEQFHLGAKLTFRLGITISTALFILALFDFAYQRLRHERSLRMTKEEVKDELRNMEGDPGIKRRRRQLQLQFMTQRLRKDVPKAHVVVTNPTHVAIAIAYDSASMSAPKVVAKGADEIALRIRQIAQQHGIPIVEKKPLARALYDAVEVGQFIPERFYQAIAEILAYVYELTGRYPLAAGTEAR